MANQENSSNHTRLATKQPTQQHPLGQIKPADSLLKPKQTIPPVVQATTRKYPVTLHVDHTSTYKSHRQGTVEIRDPFIWLEQDTTARKAWLEQQNGLTRSVLTQVDARVEITKMMQKTFEYERFSCLSFQGDKRWYWSYNQGSMARPKIYRSSDETLPLVDGRLNGSLYFDVNQLSKDGIADVTEWAISPNGSYFAYAISPDQTDDVTIYVRFTNCPFPSSVQRVVNGHEGYLEGDVVKHSRFTEIAWTKDSRGFFYQKYVDGRLKLYYHRMHNSADKLILEESGNESPDIISWTVYEQFLRGSHQYLVVLVREGTNDETKVWICDLEDTANKVLGNTLKWKRIVDRFDAEYIPICNIGTKFYFRTNHNADKYKIIMIDIAAASYEATVVIPEDPDAVLHNCVLFNNDLLAIVRTRKLYDELYVHSLTPGRLPVQLQKGHKGSIDVQTVSLDQAASKLLISLRKFTEPMKTMLYDAKKGLSDSSAVVVMKSEVKGIGSSELIIEDLEFISKDKTVMVPMTTIRHKSVECDGTAHALLYAYGGFGLSVDHSFQPDVIPCLAKYKIIFAIAYVRGGGELGEGWHRAGKGFKKKNSFDDFVSAAEHLVTKNYASRGKITILGGSNGGLLVGATYNRAPDGLLGAAIAKVGIMDMIRYCVLNKDSGWEDEYGDPSDAKMFDYLLSYSPYHNVANLKTYPSIMLMTGSNDSTVNPAHSFKHVARLQELCAQRENLCLLRLDGNAGHGVSLTTTQEIDAAVDMWCFIVHTLKVSRLDARNGVVNSSRTDTKKSR